MSDGPVMQRVRGIVEPITSDLELDLYDLEQRGATLRITLDAPVGSATGLDMDKLALATRLISREMDHQDPIPGKYTLEITTPGVERTLRLPQHFQREVGKTVSIRLADTTADERRFEGELIAADDTTATVRIDVGGETTDRIVEIASIDRARTVFVWGPQPKSAGKGTPKKKKKVATEFEAVSRSKKESS